MTDPTGAGDPGWDDSGWGLVPKLVVAGIAVFVALTIIGWIVGAIISVLRLLAVIGVCVAVIWAIGSARADR